MVFGGQVCTMLFLVARRVRQSALRRLRLLLLLLHHLHRRRGRDCCHRCCPRRQCLVENATVMDSRWPRRSSLLDCIMVGIVIIIIIITVVGGAGG